MCPGLHVYHYNHYEPTSVDHLTELHGTRQEAVGALMGRFATREDEVDDLFRLGVFVDLYRVVRQGVQAGVESYSIKRLEPLCGYERQVDLREATASLIAFEAALEDGTAAGDAGRQRVVAGYNEDDCRPRWPCGTGWRTGGAIWPNGPANAAAPGCAEPGGRPRTPRSPGSGRRCWTASPRRRRRTRTAGAGAAGRPARLAPAGGQARLVAVLLCTRAEPRGTDRRTGRAGRAHRRRDRGPGQPFRGAALLLPAAGAPVLVRADGVSTSRPDGAGWSGRWTTRTGRSS